MSRKYKFKNECGVYFISTAVVYWMDVLTRREYKDKLVESLEYCCKNKGLIIYAYVIMSNHIHLLIGKEESSKTGFSEIIRDFKKYTAMQILKSISENSQESRKEWMLWMFKRAGNSNGNNTNYQFWQQHNQPIEITGNLLEQKIDYIHNNPVEAGWVSEPHEYYYSSARNYSNLDSPLRIASVFDGSYI
ncbi:MAG: REP-associated tyrosine transposase [Bacteroidota bacterium]